MNERLYCREQTERERRGIQTRSEQLQHEIERLKDELVQKKEMIFEKEKLIQDTQYQNREILLERQSIEERISNEYKRFNELGDKYVISPHLLVFDFMSIRNRLLEEEVDRLRKSQISNRR